MRLLLFKVRMSVSNIFSHTQIVKMPLLDLLMVLTIDIFFFIIQKK